MKLRAYYVKANGIDCMCVLSHQPLAESELHRAYKTLGHEFLRPPFVFGSKNENEHHVYKESHPQLTNIILGLANSSNIVSQEVDINYI